jgi:methyl-accepting chemotaxis protein
MYQETLMTKIANIVTFKRSKVRVLENKIANMSGKLNALDKSQAVIEFSMDGLILTANDNFLQAMGYRLEEIQGQHHRIFMDAKEAQGLEYAQFWQQLNRGEFVSSEFKRLGKGNKEIWIQASYNPILDDHGNPIKVVKFATDITQQKIQGTDYKGKIEAISKSQAVIEFTMDGIIENANDNFLNAMGYSLNEVKGQHHSIFVEQSYKNSNEYRQFWQALNRGEFSAGEFKRLAKNGKEIWIQASYNPIFDLNGKPIKVVKYASDITAQKLQASDYQGQIEAIGKSQAVIEFTPEGKIVQANDNFLNAMGYTMDEVEGQHHSTFVEPAYKNSSEYARFWQDLKNGIYAAGEYKRIGKGGKEIWIQASYNPIMDLSGKVFKVVKYASDITQQKLQSSDFQGQIDAIGKSQAIIEFTMDGIIENANDNFLNAMGYSLDEIKAQHHSLFVEKTYAESSDYRQFWQSLNQGKYSTGEYKRIAKGGKEIWIQASYNPIFDLNGKPIKVVKYASDITAQKLQSVDYQGQIDAIGKSQAVIEFTPDGNILQANENFLSTLGYTLDEVKGQHHSLFVEHTYKNSAEYKRFWQDLKNGIYSSGEFKRIGKDGKEIWIQASYNPILDLNGKPFKVVKFASDITQQKLQSADYQGQIEAIGKSQAVIEFTIDGTIINANDNFLDALGYSMDEIEGQHHSLFVEQSYKNSPEYKAFWKNLGMGKFDAGEYKRIGKGGKEIWIQASYNPIMDFNGKPIKVVKYASDITQQKIMNADYQGQIEAIGKSQAVIEFNMDGTIINANDNFLSALGYQLNEIKGQHHRLFVDADTGNSAEYQRFWEKLNLGEFESAEYKRLAKGGREVWIQASYNPIMDMNGKPFKVVKYATDITGRKFAVKEISESLLSLSQGDLSNTINVPLEGEFDVLKDAMNSTIQRFFEMVSQIRTSADSVSSSAGEIQAGTTDLSQRTESQASSLEETSASVEELTQTVNQNADNAKAAVTLAEETNTKATLGGGVVGKAVNAMKEIGDASNKIADIISVIDEIAFQTNLLALNAAVEAARAGEQGRGFAVVAAEVRNLAQRSAEAAKEIKGLINDSVGKVAEGTRLVDDSGETLQGIVESIKSVLGLISNINIASQEQATGINHVNTAISQMDTMTQQNAALVEETSAVSASMNTEARKLQELMRFFK